MKIKKIKIVLTICILLIDQTIVGQKAEKQLKFGTYKVDIDWSIYFSLTINEDRTFTYIARDKFGSYSCKGKWKVRRGKLLLFDYQPHISRHINTKWTISTDKLCMVKSKWCWELEKMKQN